MPARTGPEVHGRTGSESDGLPSAAVAQPAAVSPGVAAGSGDVDGSIGLGAAARADPPSGAAAAVGDVDVSFGQGGAAPGAGAVVSVEKKKQEDHVDGQGEGDDVGDKADPKSTDARDVEMSEPSAAHGEAAGSSESRVGEARSLGKNGGVKQATLRWV